MDFFTAINSYNTTAMSDKTGIVVYALCMVNKQSNHYIVTKQHDYNSDNDTAGQLLIVDKLQQKLKLQKFTRLQPLNDMIQDTLKQEFQFKEITNAENDTFRANSEYARMSKWSYYSKEFDDYVAREAPWATLAAIETAYTSDIGKGEKQRQHSRAIALHQ